VVRQSKTSWQGKASWKVKVRIGLVAKPRNSKAKPPCKAREGLVAMAKSQGKAKQGRAKPRGSEGKASWLA